MGGICGLDHMNGDAVVVMMADESDDCRDVVRYWRGLNRGWDYVFGSRFTKGGGVINYPKVKLVVNRLANFFLKTLFAIRLNDTTNAFKAYRREVIEGCRPLISPHFNLTVELPLKAIVRGYSWTVIPITWRNRRVGEAKLGIREMGSRYLFICLYISAGETPAFAATTTRIFPESIRPDLSLDTSALPAPWAHDGPDPNQCPLAQRRRFSGDTVVPNQDALGNGDLVFLVVFFSMGLAALQLSMAASGHGLMRVQHLPPQCSMLEGTLT